ncbi:hypothetical protein QBC40DRAFT_253755 [Triangularia verruculosa]|uniref:Uncharacterized protein n=1 Tax=Triangularia verruculosa TaxID=2587418 RepID=A0AAN6XK47_9PEZI|nr:hypothetical protein QBC40DRAFT_253755 [Triangularia verruculosa]
MATLNAIRGIATVMRSLATALVSWLITGALGSIDWRPAEPSLLVIVTSILGTTQLLSLLILSSSAGDLWPRSAGAYAISAILGFGATTIWAILGSAWARHPYLGVFCSLAGVYLGLAVEGFTGVFGRVRDAWAATVAPSSSSSSSQDSGAMVARGKRD